MLWLCLEEHLADLLDRLRWLKLESPQFYCTYRTPETFDELEITVRRLGVVLVVVDTLPALVERYVREAGSSAQWTPVMRAIARIARSTGAAVLLLHHSKKSDGRYRDSTAIGAGVDMILEMERVKDAPRSRDIFPRGRWSLGKFRIAYDGVGFSLVGEAPNKTDRILRYLRENPGSGMRKIRKAVPGRGTDIDAAVRQLESRGLIHNIGTEKSPKYELVSGVPHTREDRDTPSDIVSHPTPHRGDTGTPPRGQPEEDEFFTFEIPLDTRPPGQRGKRR